jgi:hypothetical protein
MPWFLIPMFPVLVNVSQSISPKKTTLCNASFVPKGIPSKILMIMKFVPYSLLARKQIQPIQIMAYGMLLQAIALPNVFHYMNHVLTVFIL